MKILLWSTLFLASTAFGMENFYLNHAEGWFWYKKEEVKEKRKKLLKLETNKILQVDVEKEKLEQALKLAYQVPSDENLIKFITLRNKIVDRSYNFGLRLKQVSLLHPELDKLTTYPTNHLAKDLYIAEKRKLVEEKISALANKYGLFYIFSSKCPYCHAFAPTVKNFANKFGWKVLPITLDQSIPDFPKAQLDNGITRKLNIVQLPTLIAVEPIEGKTIPIAVGIISEEQLIEQIDLLTREVKS